MISYYHRGAPHEVWADRVNSPSQPRSFEFGCTPKHTLVPQSLANRMASQQPSQQPSPEVDDSIPQQQGCDSIIMFKFALRCAIRLSCSCSKGLRLDYPVCSEVCDSIILFLQQRAAIRLSSSLFELVAMESAKGRKGVVPFAVLIL